MTRFIFHLSLWIWLTGGMLFLRADNLDRTTDGDGVKLSLSSPYTQVPPGGAVPFQVTIRNDHNFSGTWRMSFRCNANYANEQGSGLEQNLTVAGNSSATFDLLVPMPISATSRNMNNTLQIGVTGPGFNNSGLGRQYFAYFYNNNSNPRSPFTLIGKQVLAPVGTGPLEKYYKDRTQEFYGSEVSMEKFPTDWRAYSGAAGILLMDSEWQGLKAAQREAICDYVAQGGNLTVFAADNSPGRLPELQLPTPDGKPGGYGFGKISVDTPISTEPLNTNPIFMASEIDRNQKVSPHDTDEKFSTWYLRKTVGVITLSAAFILSFVVIFGTLVGPVNLFVFARGKNRFRLFWTTPIISLLASLALIAGILVTDGLGGTGERFIVIYSLPDSHREAVIQEQIARTAVLFSNQWKNSQNYLMTPVSTAAMNSAMDDSGVSGYTTATSTYYNQVPDNYLQEGDTLSGDWFRSRAISGHYLQAMLPTRSALTVLNADAVAAGQAPVILSSFAHELTKVFLIDQQGKFWLCEHLKPGSKETCTASTDGDYRLFWASASKPAGGKLRPALNAAAARPGCFYATGRTDASEALATLGEIRWRETPGIYLGTWVASNTPETSP